MNAAVDEIRGELLAPPELLPPDPGNHDVFYDRYSGSFWIPDGEGFGPRSMKQEHHATSELSTEFRD